MALFNNLDKDVLREVGNIGSGHASVAMSLLTNQKTHISHTQTNISSSTAIIRKEIKSGRIPNIVHINIEGDINGEAFLLLFDDTSENIIKILKNKRKGYTTPLDDSILSEFGNILIGSYLNALSNLINLILRPTVPELHRETDLRSMLNKISKEKTITIRTDIFIKEEHIQAAIILAFSKPSLNRILNRTKLKNILIADNSASKRIKKIFSNFGNIKLYSAETPEKALELYKDHSPDICFVDIKEADIIRKIRKEKHKSQIVITSGKRITKPKIKKIGANDFLKKPFKKDHIIKFIDG